MSDNKENVPTPVQEEVKHVDSPPAEEAKAEVAKKAEEKPTPANAGEDSPKKKEKQPEPITDEPETKAEEKPAPANAGEDSPKKKEKQPEPITDEPETKAEEKPAPANAGEDSPKKKEKQPEPVTDKPETSADAKSVSDVRKAERAIILRLEHFLLCEPMANYENGWVPLSAPLKRMTSPEPNFTKVMEALNNSDGSLLQLSEDKQRVRHHPKAAEMQERTVYVDGFPRELNKSELADFIAQYHKVVNFTMLMEYDKSTESSKFKGCVFIIFETKEQAQAFLENEKIVCQEHELLRKWQLDYYKEKQEKIEKKNAPKHAILMFAGAPETATREEILQAFEKVKDFDMAYMKFKQGDTKGLVRLTEADAAEKYLEKLEDGKLKFNDEITLTLRKATKEEEQELLNMADDYIDGRKRHGDGGDPQHGNKKARLE